MKKECIIVMVVVMVFGCMGCEEPLRFAPSEVIKEASELTHLLARKIESEGTEAHSPASKQLVKGTQANLTYVGRPKVQPDPEQFDTITSQAQSDAEQRPDAWQVADSAMDLGIGICALLGGVAGTKGVKALMDARAKSKALQEIVAGNELFKNKGDPNINGAFATAQNEAQSKETKQVVAQLKLT